MTFADATPTQSNRQPTATATATVEHTVTRDTSGALRCDCRRFKVNAVMYGEGVCDHTAAIERAQAPQAVR